MNIRIHSGELNRIMKTIVQCTDPKDISNKANVRITYADNRLTFLAASGASTAEMFTPVMGGDGESFCVDAAMLSRVCAMQSGEISMETDGKTCVIRGVGRTRLPIVNASIPEMGKTDGRRVTVKAEDLIRGYEAVNYAVATDLSRIQLTGILAETDGNAMKLVAIDGFQLSFEEVPCGGDTVKMIIPSGFLKMVCQCVGSGEEVTLVTDGKTVTAEAEGTRLRIGLLGGEFIDYGRILPKEFAIRCKFKASEMRDALKAGNAVNSRQNLVKLEIGADEITVQNNSEQADFEAKVACMTQGDPIRIAFNQKYLANMISAVDVDEPEIGMNGPTAAVVIRTEHGCRLTLPVRVMG